MRFSYAYSVSSWYKNLTEIQEYPAQNVLIHPFFVSVHYQES